MTLKKCDIIKKPARIVGFSYIADLQGCGTIRVIYPSLLLPHLRIKGYNFSSFYSAYFINDVDFYKNFTYVQFQRPATKNHLSIFKHFRDNIRSKSKTPLFYEIDDLLTDIPEWNFAHEYYCQNIEYIKEMMSIADGMTVSTDKLKEIYSEYNNNIEVIPNHLPKFIWGDIYPKHEYEPNIERPLIMWAGSQNHFAQKHMKDVEGGDFGSKLMNFIRKTVNDYRWVFSGSYPIELEDIKNKIEIHGWKSVLEYPKHFKDLEPDICIAPLEKCVFNEAKSDIKTLEFTAVGASGIYSKIEPYKKMTLQADNDEEMISMIEMLAKDIDMRKRVYNKDRKTVNGQLWWEKNNNMKFYIDSYLRLINKKLEK
uniref:Glycosyltransferase n=1 Tax=viral metagenome TaxID=1070528 RepID=A0A6M3ILX3_9ZZZZ